MTRSTAATPAADVLAHVISTVAGADARPRADQIRAVDELVEHRRRVLTALLQEPEKPPPA